jgi:hypothetical protein
MKHVIAICLGMLTLSSNVGGDVAPQTVDIVAFDVVRGGRPLGTHIVRFQQSGDTLQVRTDIDLGVRFGPITVFRYEHDAVETWRDGVLVGFESTTLKDGKNLAVSAQMDGDTWQINAIDMDGDTIIGELPVSLALSSHWNGYDVTAREIFNTETGTGMAVSITDLGTSTIEVMGRQVSTRHIRMEGTLTVDLWYGADGEWLRCEFEARGETVEYVRVPV